MEPRGQLSPERLNHIASAAEVSASDSVPAVMFDFVKRQYAAGLSWEETRDAIYQRSS